MNRIDFMQQLESLLQGISPMERDEAIQYYNDYFDDAGKENEQDVIAALGNPARVAENIKRDLLSNGYGEGASRRALASDRAVMEYGKEIQETASESDMPDGNVRKDGIARENSLYNGTGGGTSVDNNALDNNASNSTAGGNTAAPDGGDGNTVGRKESSGGTIYGSATSAQQIPTGGSWLQTNVHKLKKAENSGWTTALIIALLIFTSPIWLGLITGAAGVVLGIVGTLIGVLVAWFMMILAFGMVVVGMVVALVVLVVVGFMCMFTDPWVGMAMIGGGLVCGGIGMLFLMLTVAMAGIATPAIFRGIGYLFRLIFRKKPVKQMA